MELFIDARMLDHSGIGVYLSNVLPGVLRRCAALDPVLLTLPRQLARARELAAPHGRVLPWRATPLSVADLLPPSAAARGGLWWSPHFNVPLLSRAPLVVTLHDLLPLDEAGGSVAAHKRAAARLWLGAIRRRARQVICDSEFTRRDAIRLGGIDPGRTRVAHLGVDPSWTAGATQQKAGAPPHLVFVGLVKPHKNLPGLLRAFETLMPAIPHHLVVVGQHTGLRDVDRAALAIARRLGARVELLEDVAQSRLVQIVATADLLVQPSFTEGFGLPVLEAMAAGTPVLAARAGALPEVCGDAAAYCDPHSSKDIARAIHEIVADPRRRAGMRERGRARARAFTWESCAEATSRALLGAWNER
jgi:glycosyltransferase involved in cell wall biosynthesis